MPCVFIHEQNNVALTERCQGFAQAMTVAGGTVKVIQVNGSYPYGAQLTITKALQADSSIDGVLTVGILGFSAASRALSQLNKLGTIKLGTFDVSSEDLGAVEAGHALFVIDQQPYLEGYVAIQILAFQIGLVPLTRPIGRRSPGRLPRPEPLAALRRVMDDVR